MAFPDDALYARTEIYRKEAGLGGWRDVSSDVYTRAGIRITRGRGDESSDVDPSSIELTFNNRDGVYSPRNPRSPLFGLIGRNTQLRVSVGTSPSVEDTFTRTVANSWSGGALSWSLSGGTVPDDYDVNGAKGLQTHPAANVIHYSHTNIGQSDHRVRAVINISVATPATAGVTVFVLGRMTDTSNWYAARMNYSPTGEVSFSLAKTVGGIGSAITAPVVTHALYTGLFGVVQFTVELYVEGSRLYAKIWDSTNHDETVVWNVTAIDTDLPTGERGGVASRRDVGNTDANLAVAYDSFLAVPGTFRATGEVSAWPPRWDVSGKDVYTPVVASGVFRRLSQGNPPAHSPLFRAHALGSPLAYWPLEDKRDSDTAASGVDDVLPMAVIDKIPGTQLGYPEVDGQPVWEEPGGSGSAALVSLRQGGQLRGTIPASTSTSWRFEFAYRFDAGTDLGFASIPVTLHTEVYEWSIAFNSPANTIQLAAGSIDGSVVGASIVSAPYSLYDGLLHHVRLDVEQNGGDVDHELFLDGVSVGTDSWAGFTLPVPTVAWVNSYRSSGEDNASVGHWAIYAPIPSSSTTVAATAGHNGETAAARLQRLCDEEGIPFSLIGDAADTEAMGIQQLEPTLSLMRACETLDMGTLFEPRHSLVIAYRTRTDIYNQAAALALDYATAGHVSPPLEPVEDDQRTRNDITVNRIGGSSARAVRESGSLNVNLPRDDPQGVGRYDDSVTLNAESDSRLGQLAQWMLHKGTWDEARYRALLVNLRAAAALAEDVARVDVTDVVTIDNPPEWLPAELIELLVEGYSETIDLYEWLISFATSPARIYTVGIYNDESRYDSAYSTTDEAITTGTDTSLDVAIEAGRGLWVTGSGIPEFPFDIDLLGAQVTVTAITGAASPQTFTLSTTVANGVVKDIPAGTPVRLWSEARYAL